MATTTETLTVNGVVLNTLAKNIESLTGRLKIPQLRTENIAVPGRHGRLRTQRKYYEESILVLPMWVVGCDDNGVVTNNRQQFFQNLDQLTQLFKPGNGMLEVLHTLPDGTVRRVWAEVTEAIDFSTEGGSNPLGKFSVALKVPSVFWEDQTAQSLDMLPTQNGAITPFTGMTAPIEDAVFTITGPATNTRIEALYNGSSLDVPCWFQYAATVPAGQTLTVDCGKWTLTGGGGYTADYSQLSHAGTPRWLTIVPGPVSGAPQLLITSSGTTGATKVNLTAKRKYLVG